VDLSFENNGTLNLSSGRIVIMEKLTADKRKKTEKERNELLELWYNCKEEEERNRLSQAYGGVIHNCTNKFIRMYEEEEKKENSGKDFVAFIKKKVECSDMEISILLIFMDYALENGGACFCGSGLIHCNVQQD